MIVTFSDHLRSLMDSRKLKAADLARATGITHVAIGNYLNGRVPKWDQAQKLAEFFGVHPDYLLNPAKYSQGITVAAEAVSKMKDTEAKKTLLFNKMVKADAHLLMNRQQGWEDAMQMNQAAVADDDVNWKERCLVAEKKLAEIKDLLKITSETL